MEAIKKDNSYLADKVFLRVNNLPKDNDVMVLDCYGGKGVVWNHVASKTKKNIRRLAIDTRKDNIGFYLPGDNLGYLETLDIHRFNVIDLDAWGIPRKQIKTLFDREYHGTVFVTFIQSLFGAMPREMLNDIGIPNEMIEKCPTLFYRSGWEYFLDWLGLYGVSVIRHRSKNRKHYLCFTL